MDLRQVEKGFSSAKSINKKESLVQIALNLKTHFFMVLTKLNHSKNDCIKNKTSYYSISYTYIADVEVEGTESDINVFGYQEYPCQGIPSPTNTKMSVSDGNGNNFPGPETMQFTSPSNRSK